MRAVVEEGLLERLDWEHFQRTGDRAVHGTSREAWAAIQNLGLNRMSRNHIHFARDFPEGKPLSGARQSCQVFVELDVQKALSEGVPLFLSKNGVVLSPGLEGVIPCRFFKAVYELVDGQRKPLSFASS